MKENNWRERCGGRRLLSLLLMAALLLQLAACSMSSTANADILTQKSTPSGRTQITVLVKNAFAINSFEKTVEEKFPDIDLVQVGNYTRDMGIAEYEARMEHDDLTDIIMTWPLNAGEEYWEERLLDLSGMGFTNSYNLSMLNNIARDGKLYYLPGPAQVRGIVYNKTLFEENGWKVPKDFKGFVQLCKTIEATGIRSIQLGFGNSEVLDTAFTGYNYGSYFSHPQDTQWLDGYNHGTGSFGDHFDGALDVFQQMIDAGVWKSSDLNVTYSDREKMLFSRQCAMVEDSVLMARMGFEQTGTNDEFALMPFYNPGEDNDWARLYMVCYIGMNKHLADPDNKSKYEKAINLMNYISTTEGQNALAADTGAMFSSLIGAEPPDIPEIQDLLPALNRGRYAVFPTLENSQSALREGLAGMLRGELGKSDVVRMVDAQNLHPLTSRKSKLYGMATEDFTLIDTGNYITDAIRSWSDCEIALFLDNGKDGQQNGKGISARFYKGDITELDLERVMPDLKTGDMGTLWKGSISGADLLKTLEHSISVDNNRTGWFYYFSGLKMEFDPTALPGSRIGKITSADGSPIDPERLYTVVMPEGSVSEKYLSACEKTGVSAVKVVAEAIESAGTISPAKDGRFTVIKQ